MGTVIWILLGLTGAAVVGFGVALARRGAREYEQQHQIVPGRASAAPRSWAGAHSPEAKLHRRLVDAVAAARADPRLDELGLTSQVAAIETEALAIDERLVAAAALPDRRRDEAIERLAGPVAELEDTVAELVAGVSVADTRELLEQTVSCADLRLRALAEARAEIEAIDRAAGGSTGIELPDAAPDGTGTRAEVNEPQANEDEADEDEADEDEANEDEPGTATG